MPVLFTNNASTTLSAGINNSTTTIAIASASGFPSLSSGKYYFGTISNTNNTKIEIVKVTSGTTSLTVTRAQDGTSAQAFDSGDNFQLRVTAATLSATSVTDVAITGGSVSADTLIAKGDGASADGQIQLNCRDNSHGIKLKSPPHSASADYTLTFPNNDGDANQKLTTNGSGVLTWTDDAATDSTKMPLSGGAFSGAVTTNSTIDGRDVAADGVLATNAMPKSGGAFTGAVTTNSTFDGVDVAAAGTLATNAMPKAGGAFTGAVTTNSTIDGRDVAADGVTADAALPKAGGAMTGAITTNSTFDGVDIATRDGVLTSTTATAAAALPKAGGTMTGNTIHTDNSKDIYGTDSDLEMYHSGSHAYITNTTGDLIISDAGGDITIQAKTGENSIVAKDDGAVELYHNDAKKFETTAAGATVTGTLTADLADDSINSEHYVDGSIDLAHISSQAVDEDNLYISNAGSNGQFLSKQSGNNGGLTWADAGGDVPSGAVMVFFQSGAPSGWTKVTSQNDKALRVVSGNGGGTGGSAAFSSPAHNIAAGNHTLSTNELASHSHDAGHPGNAYRATSIQGYTSGNANQVGLRTVATGNAGGGAAHGHSTSGSITAPQYIDVIICSKD